MPKIEFLPLTATSTTTANQVNQPQTRSVDFSEILNQTISRTAVKKRHLDGKDIAQSEKNILIDATHSHHRPTNNEGSNKKIDFQQKMLGLRAYRQQIIASNIANSDTPGYKAIDIDIEDAAKHNEMERLPLAQSSPNHLDSMAHKSSPSFSLKYRVPFQASVDSNTVEMDVERQHFAENAVMYQFTLDQVGGDFKEMIELFKNIK